MLRVLASLAIRNLWRHKKRTFLTLIALAFGVFSLIAMDSLLEGLDRMSSRNIIDLETGHLQIQPPEYFDADNPLTLDYAFTYEELVRELSRMEVAHAPRLQFAGQLHTGWEEYGVTVVGVDPTKDDEVFLFREYVEGSWIAPGREQVVLGRRVAQLLDLQVGDLVTMVMRTKAGAFQAIDLEVVGLLASPHPLVNRTMALIPLDIAQAALGMEGWLTHVALRTQPGEMSTVQRSVAEWIQGNSEAAGLAVYPWQQMAREFLAISESKRIGNIVLLTMIVSIAVVGIVNTILLAAIERTREIGMLKAMGMRDREIVYEFMLEALGIGFFGAVIGTIMGSLLNLYFVNVGLDFTNLIGDIDMGYPVLGSVYGVWNWSLMVMAIVIGVVVSVAAGLLPAVIAARRDPIWALRQ